VGLNTEGTVRLFNVPRGGRPLILRASQYEVLAVAFLSDGSAVASVADDENLRIWGLSGLTEGVLRTPPLGANATAELGSDGLVASSAQPNLIRLWECATCRPVDDVLELARDRATRTMTPEERRIYLHEPRPD
jgi:WD40 repeat protein